MAKPEPLRITDIELHEMMPSPGDKILIVNTGYSFEVYNIAFEEPQLLLTDEDIEFLKAGKITWN